MCKDGIWMEAIFHFTQVMLEKISILITLFDHAFRLKFQSTYTLFVVRLAIVNTIVIENRNSVNSSFVHKLTILLTFFQNVYNENKIVDRLNPKIYDSVKIKKRLHSS